ncbi:alpha/beta fold hydrolase [Saccharopolyspora pogona]|uniref:alpha/beta fold hydrolase n=1 Tax=Saccharopolyspora pogona TaxID=333966 RepID=UPI0016870D28|nr:alpha/beta fold hydrolase [Saccharopolyspora pogona]
MSELQARFDVVTWDPRDSWPTWGDAQRHACVLSGPQITFPLDQVEFDAKAADNAAQADRCRQLDPELYDNMDSGAHARELDAIRQALGEQQLNYFGQSYGGVIGVDWCCDTTSCSMHGQDLRTAWRKLDENADHRPIPVPGTQNSYSGFDLENAMQPFLGVSRYAELDQAIAAAPATGTPPDSPSHRRGRILGTPTLFSRPNAWTATRTRRTRTSRLLGNERSA